MKIVTKIMMIFMISSFVISQSLFNQYDIPEYTYSTFQVSGQDLFSMRSEGDISTMDMNVGADYMSMSQSPGFNLSYGVNFDYNSNDDGTDSDDASTSNWNMNVPFAADKYFGGTKGGFGFANGTLSMWGGDDVAEGDENTGDLYLTVGAGFGRVVSAKPVAQAYAIADAIDGDNSDETILAVAAVLGKGMEYYTNEYKDDADQQFFNDLAEAAGNAGAAMTIRKVLESPAYNISDRSAGWSVKAGLTNNYMAGEGIDDYADSGYMFAEAKYAMPMDVNAQLTVTATMYSDLNSADDPFFGDTSNWGDSFEEAQELMFTDDGTWLIRLNESSLMTLNATYSLDHSYNWSTSAWFDYASWDSGIEDANALSSMTLGATTTKAVLNKMTVTGNFGYTMLDDGDDDTEEDQ